VADASVTGSAGIAVGETGVGVLVEMSPGVIAELTGNSVETAVVSVVTDTLSVVVVLVSRLAEGTAEATVSFSSIVDCVSSGTGEGITMVVLLMATTGSVSVVDGATTAEEVSGRLGVAAVILGDARGLEERLVVANG
jgi:hypothetical protein